MFDTDLFDLGASQLMLDQLLKPALEQFKTYFYVSGAVSLLLIAALVWLFAFHLPKQRKLELERTLDLHFYRFSRQLEAEYSVKFQELSKALERQTALLDEALAKLRDPDTRQ